MRNVKRKIVLIDDNKWITDLYGEKLRREGFKVFISNNGKDGFKLICFRKPSLVLLDMVMSKGDGIYVLNKMKKNSKTKDIPVIVLTNLSSPIDKEQALASGATDYAVKADFTPAQIVSRIRRILK